jgi:glycosyltransferase involved in cell wall biosynthesis
LSASPDVDRLEIIVSDNASTDGTRDIVARHVAEDPRVRLLVADTNVGAAKNFNLTVDEAHGEYFCWAAADDLRSLDAIERMVAELEGAPDVALAYGLAIDIGPEGELLKTWGSMPRAVHASAVDRFRDVVENERVAFSVFGLVRTSQLRRTSLIAPFAGSDWSLLAEIALLGRFVEVQEVLFHHREHPGRSTRVHKHSMERGAWFDTMKAGRPTYPYWCLLRAYLSASVRLAGGASTKVRCLGVTVRWTWAWKRRLLQELRSGLRFRLRRR